MKREWDKKAQKELNYWKKVSPSIIRKIDRLLKDIENGGDLGNPKPLKHGLKGYWSRRITQEHRLVYKVIGNQIHIKACKEHYGDR